MLLPFSPVLANACRMPFISAIFKALVVKLVSICVYNLNNRVVIVIAPLIGSRYIIIL